MRHFLKQLKFFNISIGFAVSAMNMNAAGNRDATLLSPIFRTSTEKCVGFRFISNKNYVVDRIRISNGGNDKSFIRSTTGNEHWLFMLVSDESNRFLISIDTSDLEPPISRKDDEGLVLKMVTDSDLERCKGNVQIMDVEVIL